MHQKVKVVSSLGGKCCRIYKVAHKGSYPIIAQVLGKDRGEYKVYPKKSVHVDVNFEEFF